MRAYVIKKGKQYIGVFGLSGPLVDVTLYRTRKEAESKSEYGEKIVPVDIKEIK